MRIVETKVFKFEELSNKAQATALDHYRDINTDYDWWDGDCWLELSTDQIKARRIKTVDYSVAGACVSSVKINGSDELIPDNNANIDGFYPHYTGLFSWDKMYFDLGRGYYLQFVNLKVNDDETFRKFLRVPKALWAQCSYYFTLSGKDTVIEFEAETRDGYVTALQKEVIDRAIEIFNDHVQDGVKDLRSSYESLMEDEQVKETIISNEYEFTEEGNKF